MLARILITDKTCTSQALKPMRSQKRSMPGENPIFQVISGGGNTGETIRQASGNVAM